MTKVSRASPAVSATNDTVIGSAMAMTRSAPGPRVSPWTSDCSSTHSATNPDEIGRAAAASAAIEVAVAVRGGGN